MSEPVSRGRFVWHDLMTTDPAAAQPFYSKVAGWGVQVWEGKVPYTMWTAAGAPMGGVMDLPEDAKKMGAPPHWLMYVSVPDIEASTKQLAALGGRVYVPPQSIPEVGAFAVVADPQGATFALFTPLAEAPEQDGMVPVGQMSWHELTTDDHVAAFAFYQAMFGWEKTSEMDMGSMGIYAMFGRKGLPLPLGGMMNRPPDYPAPPNWLSYIRVADLNAALESTKALGGQVLNGPMDVPGGDTIAQCMDPQGAAFALHQVKG